MGWFSDFVSDPLGTVADTATKVVSNPIPAITSAVTGNPAALLGYAAPSGGGSATGTPGYFTGGGGSPIIINTAPQNNAALSSLAGGLLGGLGNYLVGSKGAEAAKAQADQLRQAGAQAQQQAQFRPVGVTNTFGTSQFTVDPTTGQLTAAGYSLSPSLQASQNTLMGNQAQNLTDLATIQNLGRGYLAQTPQQAAQQYIQNQQALLQPGREQAWANLANQDYNRGTMGLKVAQGGGLQAANPYAAALANAQAQQDLQLAAQAQQAGQQQTLFGQGLLSSAYQPYTTGLQAASATEQLGQSPFGLSTGLANQAATANANAARLGLTGNIAAAEAARPANQYSALGQLLSGVSTSPLATGALGGLLGGTSAGQSLGNWLGGLSNAGDWTTGSSVIPDSTFSGSTADNSWMNDWWMQ